MAEDPTQAAETTEVKVKKPIYKRVWFWVIVVLVVAVVFGGSGSDDEDEATSTTDETVAESTETADEDDADEADDADDEDEEEADEDDALGLVDFEEIVVVDNDYCSITITGVESDGLLGYYELDVTLVNKSSDTAYDFVADDGAVDGVQVDPYLFEDVAAGKTAYATVYIYEASTLEEAGVAFTDIEVAFYVVNSDDWTEDYVAETSVHVYPYGEDAATTFVREAGDDDLVVVDNDYVTVTVIGYEPDYLYGYAVDLYVVNKTDGYIWMYSSEESVNDIMVSGYFSTVLGAGRSTYETIYWLNSSLEDDAGIEDPASEVTSVEFRLLAYDYDDITTTYVDEVIALNP